MELDYFVDVNSLRATEKFSFNLLELLFKWEASPEGKENERKCLLIGLLSISKANFKNKHNLVNSS